MEESSSTSSSSVTSSSTNDQRKKRSRDQVSEEDNVLKNAKGAFCKYGSKCYRKNSAHLAEFEHPNEGIA